MKTIICTVLALALFSGNSIAAASQNEADEPAGKIVVRTIKNPCGQEITEGSPASALLNHLGQPDVKLTPDVWVYRNYHAEQKEAQDHKCDRLVITLVKGVVTEMLLVNCRAEAVIAARLRAASRTETPEEG